jgi:hypothetical protein
MSSCPKRTAVLRGCSKAGCPRHQSKGDQILNGNGSIIDPYRGLCKRHFRREDRAFRRRELRLGTDSERLLAAHRVLDERGVPGQIGDRHLKLSKRVELLEGTAVSPDA